MESPRKNQRFCTVTEGKRSQPLKSVEIDTDANTWHELATKHVGLYLTVRFDRKIVLEVEDATFKESGAVGLWTKADASTYFDDFRAQTHHP